MIIGRVVFGSATCSRSRRRLPHGGESRNGENVVRLVHFVDGDCANWRELEVAGLAQSRNEWELFEVAAELVGEVMRSHEDSGSQLFQKCSSKSGLGGESAQDVPWDRGVLTSDNGEGESIA